MRLEKSKTKSKNGFFSKNQNLSFTVIKKNRQKVTTFFSEKAGPFVKKFDFGVI